MSTTTGQDVKQPNLLDRHFYGDIEGMHEAFTWLRANEPVYHDPATGFWGLTKHHDILEAERNDKAFSSEAMYRARPSHGENNMIAQDNPGHLEQRRLIMKELIPAGVKKMEPKIRSIIGELVDHAVEQGRIDVVGDLAAQLPARLTAHMIGFPEEDWRKVQSWSERFMRIDSVHEVQEWATDFFAAMGEVGEAIAASYTERKANPTGDFMSIWAHAEVNGCPMEQDRVFNETGLFISGGAETTRTVIARSLATFVEHPDQWEAMAADPELVPGAVEEMIRWVTPLNNMFRLTTQEVTIGGTTIPAGERIAFLYPSGNRDEDVFADPFTFDIRRHPNPHVSFGFGTHFCVGANLARFELRVLMEELTSRLRNLHVISEPVIEHNVFVGAVQSFDLGFDVR